MAQPPVIDLTCFNKNTGKRYRLGSIWYNEDSGRMSASWTQEDDADGKYPAITLGSALEAGYFTKGSGKEGRYLNVDVRNGELLIVAAKAAMERLLQWKQRQESAGGNEDSMFR